MNEGVADTGPVEVHGCPGRPRTARCQLQSSSVRRSAIWLTGLPDAYEMQHLAGRTVTGLRVRFPRPALCHALYDVAHCDLDHADTD